MNIHGNGVVQSLLADLANLELRMYNDLLRRNRVARRLPARLRKRKYGKAKTPYSFTHDMIEYHGVEAWYL